MVAASGFSRGSLTDFRGGFAGSLLKLVEHLYACSGRGRFASFLIVFGLDQVEYDAARPRLAIVTPVKQ